MQLGRRQIFLVVSHRHTGSDRGIDVYPRLVCGTESTFTPVMRPEGFAEAIASAKRIVSPLGLSHC